MTTLAKRRVLVADDEPLGRRGVRQLLAPHADLTVVGESRNGLETLRALETWQPDLLFLDVRMPELDGLEVLRARGAAAMPAVIFVTAYDQFAVRAFEANAVDYLMKPLNAARFETALQRVRERWQMEETLARTAQLTALLATDRVEREKCGVERLVIASARHELVVPVEEIDWISADDYYSCVHVGAKDYLLRESLSSLEKRLDARRFVRVHRAAIIQLDRVRQLRTTVQGAEVALRNGLRIPVSRRRRMFVENLLRERRFR